MIEVTKTSIDGVLLIKPRVFADARGYFFETFSARDFASQTGLDIKFVQDNESASVRGVARGLHFQKGDKSQSKLVRCIRGSVLDIALDLRAGSPTYGQHEKVVLSEENKMQFFIPKGFAHGFVVLSDYAVFQYKCDELYAPEADGGIQMLDPDLGLDLPVNCSELIRSPKDIALPRLADINIKF